MPLRRLNPSRFAGIDLAGSYKRPSGISLVDNNSIVYRGVLHLDDEITSYVYDFMPFVVAIDAPLGLPGRSRGFREVDLALKKRGFNILPPSWRGMRLLVARALKLKELFVKKGIIVVETHPYSALKSSGCSSVEELVERILGVREDFSKDPRDVVDAVIASLVAYTYVKGGAWCIEASDGGICVLQRICR